MMKRLSGDPGRMKATRYPRGSRPALRVTISHDYRLRRRSGFKQARILLPAINSEHLWQGSLMCLLHSYKMLDARWAIGKW